MPVASNPVFPSTSLPGLGLPVVRTPIWATLTQLSMAGVDVPHEPWTYPRYRWSVHFEFLRQGAAFGELQNLMGFYNRMGGRYGVFQYDDPQDDTTPADQPFGTGDSTTVAFQLVRTRGSFVEPVFAVNTITNVKIAGVVQGSSLYSASNKGVLTFTSPPGNGTALTWTGTYLWFARFDKDEYDFEQFTVNAGAGGPLWSLSALQWTSVKFGS
jgi:uncharacterized protein (TIGR02217 family)